MTLCGCGSEEQAEEQPPLVKTVIVGTDADKHESTYTGTIRSRYETSLSFQTGGRILSRNVQAGTLVHAGDVLMTIDARDAVQQARQGDAQVAQARTRLELAEKNLARYESLYREDAIAAATLDQYRTERDAAEAAYRNALAVAEQSRNVLSYTELTANADGVISAVRAEAGQVVAAGQEVMTLSQTGEIEAVIQVPENRIGDIHEGDRAAISFWAIDGEVAGYVREISPMADSAARTYRVRISLPDPPAGAALGMTVSASISSRDAHEGIILPLAAICQTGDVPEVWVVEDSVVHPRRVSVEEFSGNDVLVVGLSPGTAIVAAGAGKLRDGQRVRVADVGTAR